MLGLFMKVQVVFGSKLTLAPCATKQLAIYVGQLMILQVIFTGKAFTTSGALRIHKMIHDEEKRFKCDVENCDQSFKIRKNLWKHKKVQIFTNIKFDYFNTFPG